LINFRLWGNGRIASR